MKRREFITLFGGAAAVAWPLTARAQPAMPVIGSLHAASPKGFERHMDGFRQGLREAGYVEGQNVMIEYRWADGSFDRLLDMMADLVHARVAVVAVWGTAVRTIKNAHAAGIGNDIPVVFAFGGDPVAIGLVASFNRPGGNVTGITSIGTELASKRLGLLRELIPDVKNIALLTNPTSPASVGERKDIEGAARRIGWEVRVLHASTADEFEPAFAGLVRERIGALIISVDTFYYGEMARLATLAERYAVPTIGPVREFAEAGGLISFGANIPDMYRLTGIYTGRVLKGAKPADLPVLQPTKFELVLNLKAAKTLGLTVPNTVLVSADEVIE